MLDTPPAPQGQHWGEERFLWVRKENSVPWVADLLCPSLCLGFYLWGFQL